MFLQSLENGMGVSDWGTPHAGTSMKPTNYLTKHISQHAIGGLMVASVITL